MLERAYRKRLDADLARWHADGTISPATHAAIRASLAPLPAGITIASVVAIVGGLLIAAAFLAFVAANWSGIARPMRFAILLAGIAVSYGLGALFARTERPVLADLAAAVGAIIFGAAIALTGQMYHLDGDFAAALLLWAGGALAAAALTGSRGALAVALTVGVIWSTMRVEEAGSFPHLAFILFWLIGAALALAWNAPVARHLVALSVVAWWIVTVIASADVRSAANGTATIVAGLVLLFGTGHAMTAFGRAATQSLGLTLSTYAGFALAGVLALMTVVAREFGTGSYALVDWVYACGVLGVVLSSAVAAMTRRAAAALVALALALGVVASLTLPGADRGIVGSSPWLLYGLVLVAMLSLVISGMLDELRPRVAAGWIGLAATIAAITWTVPGGLLDRAIFLALAGGVAVVLALLLGRLLPKEHTP
jgi:uncharacterized membrane protein